MYLLSKWLLLSTTAILLTTSCNTSINQAPEEVVEKFLNSMNNHDFETAKNYCTDETHKLVDFLSSIYGMAKQEGTVFAEPEPVTNIQCKISGNEAKCSFCCDSDGKNSEIDLVKIKNKWKVNIVLDGFGDWDMDEFTDPLQSNLSDTTLLDDIDAATAE
jgi:hypothetical protein